MNNEIGTVTKIENKEVVVEFDRQSSCGNCGACMMSKDTGKMFIRLPFTKVIRIGDRVYIDVERKFYLFSSFLLYVLF